MHGTPSLTPKELIRILKENGFELLRTKGSHQIFENVKTGKITTVPVHNKDLPRGTFFAILKQADIEL